MSLVNRMLLDLEERESGSRCEPALAGLSSVDYSTVVDRHRRSFGRLAVLAFAVLVVCLVVLWPGRSADTGSALATTRQPVRPAQRPQIMPGAVPRVSSASMSLRLDDTLYSLAQLSAQESPDTAEPAAGTVTYEAAPARHTITGLALVPADGGATLHVNLDAETRFLAYALANPSRVVVEIPGATLEGTLPQLDGTGAVRRIRAREERGRTILVLDLDGPSATVNAGLVSTGAGVDLRVDVLLAEPAGVPAAQAVANSTKAVEPTSVVEAGHLERKPAAPSDLHAAARTLCGSGRVAACLGQLSELLAREPGHVDARLLLSSTLMANGDPVQAAAALDQGLALQPGIWQWAQLRAQLAVNAGDAETAFTVLTRAPPPLADQPEYHALLAAVQQRTGRHEQAVATYHGVLARRPERGVWWMGLGISLQVLARDREAGLAYMRALDDQTLSTDLRRFIQARRDGIAEDSRT